MSKKMISRIVYIFMFVIIGWFILSFIITPVISVIREVFIVDGNFSFKTFEKLVNSNRIKGALSNTFKMAICTVLTVSLVGIFQIMLTEYFDIKGSRFLEFAYFTPLLYGGISLVRGYKFVYSSEGFITKLLVSWFPNMNPNWFMGFAGVLFVHTFSMTTYHILFVKTAFKRIDYSTIEASRNLGANNLKAFFKVALPVIKPSIFSATILVTLSALNSFAAPAMLGGKNFYMINSMIQNLNSINSKDLAALLSFVLALVCILLFLYMRWLEKRNSYISVSKVPTKIVKTKIRNPFLNILTHLAAYLLAFVYLLPVVAIVLFSLTDIQTITYQTFPKALTLENYIRVFSQSITMKPFLNSVALSLLAVVIVLALCITSAVAIHKKPGKATGFLEMTLLIPWILPSTLLAVGMIINYSTPSAFVLGRVLLGGFWLLPIAYAVISIPSAMRLIRASLYNINTAHEEAARSLGAGPVYTFIRVVFPAILPTAASVGAITFNSLLSEYTISALLYSIKNVPLGIMLRNPESSADTYTAANTLVYIVILMIISGITLALTKNSRENQY